MSSKKAKSSRPPTKQGSNDKRDARNDLPRAGTFPQFGRLLVEFELRRAEEMSELLTHRFAPVRALPVTQGGEAGITGSYAALGGVDFSWATFKGTFSIEPVQRYDGICFFLPSSGHLVVDLGGDQLVASSHKAVAVDATTYRSMTFTDGLVMPAIVVARTLIAERLSLLLGRPIIERPAFQSEVDLGASAVGALRNLVALATGPEFASVLTRGALAASRLNEMILDTLIENWPSNYSGFLRKPVSNVAPRHVKLVLEFLSDNPKLAASGAELAALSGVSLRTLQKAFGDFTGQSLADYERQVRLEGAYKDLMKSSDKAIEDVALSWGFTNAGRFSRYFLDAYGVTPRSITRRRSR